MVCPGTTPVSSLKKITSKEAQDRETERGLPFPGWMLKSCAGFWKTSRKREKGWDYEKTKIL
ncbi:MAG: hypothetical protein A2170_17805 [Deltaproteobacteria bacterium RBG_13_53_10]|nr:MAG: hypothetical protein A2170_17805 [Deltaproteobacteria bacterium RBG_13_53_10]